DAAPAPAEADVAPEEAAADVDSDEGDDGADGESFDDTRPGESRNARRRRRRRNKGGGEGGGAAQSDNRFEQRERQARPAEAGADAEAVVSTDPVQVSGYLDLRDEGYGFLRVNGYLPSRDDVYVSVKQTRQYGLRKGDRVTGLSRIADRNQKNPALLHILTVNDADPELMRQRPRFEDLTPLFPDEKLRLESSADQTNMTARIIDLIAPIGKGQRGLIVSPPKAGKTFIMK